MELVKVCAFALMGVLLALQFKGGKQEYGIYLGAALAVVVFSCTLSYMGQAKKPSCPDTSTGVSTPVSAPDMGAGVSDRWVGTAELAGGSAVLVVCEG